MILLIMITKNQMMRNKKIIVGKISIITLVNLRIINHLKLTQIVKIIIATVLTIGIIMH